MGGLTQDFRSGLRVLRLAPGFALVAVAALALGIGGTTAIFTLVYHVLIRPAPFPAPDRIVTAISVQPERGIRDGGVSYADYLDWREERDVFEYTALWRPQSLDLTGGDRPERVRALAVTGEFFQVLGATPLTGRAFGPEVEHDGERPVVLSAGAWRRLFGAEPASIGSRVHLSGLPHTLVGVLPEHLVWPSDTDVFVPLRLDPARDASLLRRDNFIFRSVARLRAGVPLDEARARVATLARHVEAEHPESRRGWSYDVVDLHAYTVGEEFRSAIVLLLGAVTLVLLIACVNVANLLLARGAERRRELAIRAALGASRARIRRALLVESLVLAAAGGAAGLILAQWLARALVLMAPPETPVLSEPRLEWPVVLFAAGATLVTTVLFGLLPALQGGTTSPGEALKTARGEAGGTGRARDVLIVGEVALAVVLLVGAALTIRSLDALGRVDPGLNVQNVLTTRLVLPSARYPERGTRALFYEQLLDELRALPGVRGAAITSRLPAGGPGFGLGRVFLAEGRPEPPAGADVPAQWTVVSPGYFRTLGIPLERGRPFDDRDRSDAVPVIIVSRQFADQMFPGEDPVGRRIRSWRDENVLREIVGVVGDVRYFGLADRPRAAVYVPHAQDAWGGMMLAVRTDGDPLELVRTLTHAVTARDPMLALGDTGALAEFSANSVAGTRFTARLLGAFAAVALLLAAIGVYGVMAYAVSRRATELGVRLALGATRGDIARLVVGRGMLLTGAGLLAGVTAGAVLAHGLRAVLPEIAPFDPLSFFVAAVTLLVAALAACLLPARRAMRLDPGGMLRG